MSLAEETSFSSRLFGNETGSIRIYTMDLARFIEILCDCSSVSTAKLIMYSYIIGRKWSNILRMILPRIGFSAKTFIRSILL